MKHHPDDHPITPKEQRANVSAMEANLAVEGLYMNPEDKALLARSIDEGWSQEETMRRMMERWRRQGVVAEDQEVPAVAAE